MAKRTTLGVVSPCGEIVRKEEKKEKKVSWLRKIPILQVLRVLIGVTTIFAFIAGVVLSKAEIWSPATAMWLLAFSAMFVFWLLERNAHNKMRKNFDLYKTK